MAGEGNPVGGLDYEEPIDWSLAVALLEGSTQQEAIDLIYWQHDCEVDEDDDEFTWLIKQAAAGLNVLHALCIRVAPVHLIKRVLTIAEADPLKRNVAAVIATDNHYTPLHYEAIWQCVQAV